MKCFYSQRNTIAAFLAIAALVVALPAQSIVAATIDYSQSLGADFYDTYPQAPDPLNVFINGLPSSTNFGPNSEWELLDPATGSSASLIATNAAPFSGQNGWCVDDGGGACSTAPPSSYFGSNWQPGVTLPVADGMMNGHGPQSINWTAPASVDAGGVSIEGSIQQLFSADRRMRLSVFKNGGAVPVHTFDSLPPTVDGVVLQNVDYGPSFVSVAPGDTLNFVMDGDGAGGNGIPTFTAWTLTVSEVPEPTSACILSLGLGALIAIRRRRC